MGSREKQCSIRYKRGAARDMAARVCGAFLCRCGTAWLLNSCRAPVAKRRVLMRRAATLTSDGGHVARAVAAARTRKASTSRAGRARQRDVASGAHPPQKCASVALLTIIAAILFCACAVSSAVDVNGRRSPVQHICIKLSGTLLSYTRASNTASARRCDRRSLNPAEPTESVLPRIVATKSGWLWINPATSCI